MKPILYFVNEIFAQDKNDYKQENVLADVVLLKVPDESIVYENANRKAIESILFRSTLNDIADAEIQESSFVYRKKGTLSKANTDDRAKREVFWNNLYRGKLIRKYTEPRHDVKTEESEVYSFHVNVGHGNCSFIVFKENE